MPDRHDAMLLLRLAQWSTSMGLEEATAEIFSDGFDPDTATVDGSPAVQKVLYFGETLGTLTKHGLFSTELALDWAWVAGPWSRVAPAALRDRAQHGVPALYENFEALASRQSR